MAAVPTAARRRSLAAAKAAAHVTHSPVDVRQEVHRTFQQTGEKGICLPALDGVVALQRWFSLEVVVHPTPMLAETLAISHVSYDIVPAHSRCEEKGPSAHRAAKA